MVNETADVYISCLCSYKDAALALYMYICIYVCVCVFVCVCMW